MSGTKTKVFICYRVEDVPDAARQIYDIVREIAGGDVFMDSVSIEPGDNFVRRIGSHLSDARVLLAIIGPNWLCTSPGNNIPRLHEQDDWVAREISYGLRHGSKIVPILVHGAKMPQAVMLPLNIRELAEIHALDFRRENLGRLKRWLQALIASAEPRTSSPLKTEDETLPLHSFETERVHKAPLYRFYEAPGDLAPPKSISSLLMAEVPGQFYFARVGGDEALKYLRAASQYGGNSLFLLNYEDIEAAKVFEAIVSPLKPADDEIVHKYATILRGLYLARCGGDLDDGKARLTYLVWTEGPGVSRTRELEAWFKECVETLGCEIREMSQIQTDFTEAAGYFSLHFQEILHFLVFWNRFPVDFAGWKK